MQQHSNDNELYPPVIRPSPTERSVPPTVITSPPVRFGRRKCEEGQCQIRNVKKNK